jgi:two-component system, NtrC family, response regulator AtoC
MKSMPRFADNMPVQSSSKTILVGEDELEVRSYLDVALKCLGYSVELAQDGDEVISCLESESSRISAVLLDLMMPQRDGFETLKTIRTIDPSLPVIMISGASSVPNVVTAIQHGATDFLCKPFEHEDLRKAINRALERRTKVDHMAPSPVPARPRPLAMKTAAFFGHSPRMKEILSQVTDVGWSDAPVLIQGETGSGKEVLARELHANSGRAGKIFLKLNCAALPSELMESELFGYERGAFTGAVQKKVGMFEMADGGTLLLDEIGDMDIRLQAKLLHVLQDHEFHRIGGKDLIRVDVRVMASTHRNLEKAIIDRTFREDLFYRLNVINLELPPLREREDDIIPMAEFLLNKHAGPGVPAPIVTSNLKQALLSYHWPGNVRELENVIRNLLVFRNADSLASRLRTKVVPIQTAVTNDHTTATPIQVEAPPDRAPVLADVTKAKRQAEIEAILAALHSTHWNRKQAAALLKVDYKAFLYKMKKLGVPGKFGSPAAGTGSDYRNVAVAGGR